MVDCWLENKVSWCMPASLLARNPPAFAYDGLQASTEVVVRPKQDQQATISTSAQAIISQSAQARQLRALMAPSRPDAAYALVAPSIREERARSCLTGRLDPRCSARKRPRRKCVPSCLSPRPPPMACQDQQNVSRKRASARTFGCKLCESVYHAPLRH